MAAPGRTLLYPLVALAVVAGLVYLKPSRAPDTPGPAESGGADVEQAPAADQPFSFVRSVPLPPPPAGNFDPLTPDRVMRWGRRLLWAPPSLVIYTKDKLTTLSDEEARRFVEFARAEWESNPTRAHVLLTAVGQFDSPAAHDIVEQATLHSSAMVRSEAARALSMYNSAEAALRLEKLLNDSNPQVQRAAIQCLIDMDEIPESLEVLQRYADRDPVEGIRNVLFRIRKDSESPDAVETLRSYLDVPGGTGQTALEGLCMLGDPMGIDRCYAMLDSPEPMAQLTAITFLSAAPPDVLDSERLRAMLKHRQPEARQVVTELLFRIAKSGHAKNPEEIAELLLEQSHDRDVRVHQMALAGLYKLGRKSLAETYLKRITTATDKALHNAVDVAASLFQDPRAVDVIKQRLAEDDEINPDDVAILITGLCRTGHESAVEPLLSFIREASPSEPVDHNGNPLSKRAALEMTPLGRALVPGLVAILQEDDLHPYAYLRALDTLRGVNGVDCVEELLDVATSDQYPIEVRVAAIETLPYLKQSDIYAALIDVADELDHPDLARAARLVLADYS